MILYYVHDPMCSWCWAYRPTLELLRQQLLAGVHWQNLLGGLAPDTDEPMSGPTRQMVQAHWRRIQSELGTEFNFDFWSQCQPSRSTYIACRAVLAAAEQGQEEAMILSIQKAYYLRAKNPSNADVLVKLAGELAMDTGQFASALHSAETETELQNQIKQSRAWPIAGFPSLLLVRDKTVRTLPLDYRDAQCTLDAIKGFKASLYW